MQTDATTPNSVGTCSASTLESMCNARDGNENGKKLANRQHFHVHHAFLYISLPTRTRT